MLVGSDAVLGAEQGAELGVRKIAALFSTDSQLSLSLIAAISSLVFLAILLFSIQ